MIQVIPNALAIITAVFAFLAVTGEKLDKDLGKWLKISFLLLTFMTLTATAMVSFHFADYEIAATSAEQTLAINNLKASLGPLITIPTIVSFLIFLGITLLLIFKAWLWLNNKNRLGGS